HIEASASEILEANAFIVLDRASTHAQLTNDVLIQLNGSPHATGTAGEQISVPATLEQKEKKLAGSIAASVVLADSSSKPLSAFAVSELHPGPLSSFPARSPDLNDQNNVQMHFGREDDPADKP